ncbi:MAG: VWA domain-containing protein [Deltaproteobacteria bacterium]|nr:VWA domain-containing protein [Deltaproteobacteria bacterium]
MMRILVPGSPIGRALVVGLVSAAVVVGCTYDFEAPFAQTPGTGAAGGGGASAGGEGGSTSGAGGSSTSSNGSGGTSTSTSTSGTGGDGGSGGGTCVPDPVQLDIPVLNLILLIDRSASMTQGTLWPDTVTAVSQFLSDSQSRALYVAVNYFPAVQSTGQCQVSDYNPPHVPLTDLLNNASVIANDVSSQFPYNGTPPAPALEGSIDFAGAHKSQNANHEVVLAMVTDGEPTTCEQNPSVIAATVAAGVSQHGVRTYTIGIGDVTTTYLDLLASAGDTGQGYNNKSNTLQVSASLSDIHERAFPCSYPIPTPPQGPLQPDQVNVTYTPGGGSAQAIPHANDENDCGNGDGWTYDSNQAPTEIHFCDSTCADLRQDTAPQVEVLFGCPTVDN